MVKLSFAAFLYENIGGRFFCANIKYLPTNLAI